MKISLSPEFIRRSVPDFSDEWSYTAELDGQNRLTVSMSKRDAVTPQVLAVARWSPEAQVLEARSGLIHPNTEISEQLFGLLAAAIEEQERAIEAKLLEIRGRLEEFGLPPVRDGNFVAYLGELPASTRTFLVEGMRAYLLGEEDVASEAFRNAKNSLGDAS